MKRVCRLIVWAVPTVAALLMVALVVVAYVQAQRLTQPMARSQPWTTPNEQGVTGNRTISLTTQDGVRLNAWYAPPPTDEPGPAVVFVHGISNNRAAMVEEASMLYAEGYGVLMLDMRGHGESADSFLTFGVREVFDVRAALDHMLADPAVDNGRIGIMGGSMGGTTVLLSAQQMPEFRAVWVNSAFSSLRDAIGDRARMDFRLPARPAADLLVWFAGRAVDEDLRLASPIGNMHALADRPVQLVHGSDDDIVPVDSTLRLVRAALQTVQLTIYADEGHTDFYYAGGEEYRRRVIAFFDAALKQ